MKKITVLSAFALMSSIGYSQSWSAIGLSQTNNTKYHAVPQQIGLEGNINYFEEYQPGAVFFDDSTAVEVPLLNYNLLVNKLTLKINSDEFFIPNENKVDSFKIANKTFVQVPDLSAKNKFYEIIFNENNLELIKETHAQIVTGKEGTGMTPTTPDRIKKTNRYYLAKNGKYHEFDLNKNSIIDLLGKEKEINEFRKEKKLKFKNEEDVVQILDYYNSIQNL